LVSALVACGASESEDSPAALAAEAAPHAPVVARFDRWARRVASASQAWRSRSALTETAFAPIRTDPDVLGAWIAREGEPTLSHPHDTALPEGLRWTHARVDGLGPCELTHAPIGDAGRAALLVSLAHEGLIVTVAVPVTAQ
jgi:hypothetical protein